MKLRHEPLFYLVLFLFLLSGFSALLYQVVWQRMLGCFAGVDVYSVTITVSAFMAGLGCGSLTGGSLADRVSSGTRILIFCAAETAIALFALASKWLYYDLLYVRWSWLGNSPVLLPIILFLTLLVPTFCMGLTLPILSKSFAGKIESAAAVVGYLYGLNTLGAALGAFTTAWILFRHFSFETILRGGASLNALAAAGALLVWWRLRARATTAAQRESSDVESAEPTRFSMRVWMIIYALSGFVALGLEIVWFRLFGVLQKSTAFTFGNLLAIYLFGLALGIIAGVPFARRTRHPARWFLLAQTAAGIYAAGIVAVFIWKVDRSAMLAPLWTYLRTYEPISPAELFPQVVRWLRGSWQPPEAVANLRMFAALYFLLPTIAIAPATFLMGLSFPLLQRAVQVSPDVIGRRVGWLQTMNILGSMLGAMLVGWLSLCFVGTAGTLRILVICAGAFAVLFALHNPHARRGRILAVVTAIALLTLVVWAIPRHATLWAKLHGAYPRDIIFEENDTGLSLLKEGLDERDTQTWVYSNGLGQSWLPYGSIHTQIGIFGALLHPAPASVAVIGLGSGDTLYSLGGSPHTTQLTCIELVRPQHATLSALSRRKEYGPLKALLRDARMEWLFTDGRAYLQRTERRFDVIEADALRPNSAYSGNLYSHQYFRMIKDRLKSGGLAVSWVPTERTLASFLHVFPHVVVINGVAVGSEELIEIDPGRITRRFQDPFTNDYYARVGDVTPLLAPLLSGDYAIYGPDSPRSAAKLNSDLFPRDEFGSPETPQ